MTKKETKTDKAPKKDDTTTSKKLILFEAVQEHPEREYIIIGALTNAGLIKQYREEEVIYGKEDIKPSITIDELNKIIKNFIGE
ncbi:MAG: hypothetical protein IJ104_00585 [Methanobrevibacter sp.]|nr:hypothetical protein [Methanobrevibacter sp.]MBQ9024865.1 hypothetical protein [Methanobrevibacter sp.]